MADAEDLKSFDGNIVRVRLSYPAPIMTKEQELIVDDLRRNLYLCGYPPIYAVDEVTLSAAEQYLTEWLIDKGLDPILKCGKNGLWFKGVELVLGVSS